MAKKGMEWSKDITMLLKLLAVVAIIILVVLFIVYVGTFILPTSSIEYNTFYNLALAVNHGISILSNPLVLVLVGGAIIVVLLYFLHLAGKF